MTIARVTAVWSGFQGAPGYSNFFFDSFGTGDQVDLEVGRVVAFFEALDVLLPSVVDIDVDQEVAFFDEVTGELIGYENASTVPETIPGTAATAYSAPSGAVINWSTDTVARGRRLRGRTFIVPIASTWYENNGTLVANAIGNLSNAADALIGDGSGPQSVIWSRPRNGADGSIGPITGYRIPDMAAVLRSRRD